MKRNIVTAIQIERREDWEFILEMLDEEFVKSVVNSYERMKEDDEPDEFGLVIEEELRKPNWEKCCRFLFGEASKKMWQGITKEQANELLRSMYAVKAVSVKMKNGAEYTTNGIIKCWELANKENQEGDEI